jgi:hypothetical protein
VISVPDPYGRILGFLDRTMFNIGSSIRITLSTIVTDIIGQSSKVASSMARL